MSHTPCNAVSPSNRCCARSRGHVGPHKVSFPGGFEEWNGSHAVGANDAGDSPSPEPGEMIEKARQYTMTSEEREAQRRSFAYGNVAIDNPNVTREHINAAASTPTPATEGWERAAVRDAINDMRELLPSLIDPSFPPKGGEVMQEQADA